MDLNELKEAIQSNNIEKADNILQEIGSEKNLLRNASCRTYNSNAE